LLDIPVGTTIATTLPLLMDLPRFRNEEILGCRQDLITAGVHGPNGDDVFTFISPYNGTNTGLRKYLLDNGIRGARDNGVSALSSISSYNIFFFSTLASATIFADYDVCAASGETQANCIKRNVTSRISAMKQNGLFAYFMAHDTSTWDVNQWTAMLDAVQQSKIPTYIFSDAIDFIKTYDPSADLATADNMTYTRTLIDESDYNLQATSPAINKGVTVAGLTTDYAGNKVPVCATDIGIYEYQASVCGGGGGSFTNGIDNWFGKGILGQ
jgi:hypothetical protein